MSDARFIKPGFEQALSHFIEEMGEALAAAGKLQRHGALSVNPLLPPAEQEPNIAWLWRELDDLECCVGRLASEIRKHPDFGFLPFNPGPMTGGATIAQMRPLEAPPSKDEPHLDNAGGAERSDASRSKPVSDDVLGEVREALEPFARAAKGHEAAVAGEGDAGCLAWFSGSGLTVGDLRRASRALSRLNKEGE